MFQPLQNHTIMNLKIRNHTVFKSHATKYCKKGKEKKIMASCNGNCDMCNFSYKTSKELRQHRMNECGIEPKYPCPYVQINTDILLIFNDIKPDIQSPPSCLSKMVFSLFYVRKPVILNHPKDHLSGGAIVNTEFKLSLDKSYLFL